MEIHQNISPLAHAQQYLRDRCWSGKQSAIVADDREWRAIAEGQTKHAAMASHDLAASKFGSGPLFAAIPGGTMAPEFIPKYFNSLVIPPAMPFVGTLKKDEIDYYVIAVRQFRQQILPVGLPKTTVWGYGSPAQDGTFNYPAFTIEARYNRPVRVKWMNDLVDARGNYLPHLLPVDPTLHWAIIRRGESAAATCARCSRVRPALTGVPFRWFPTCMGDTTRKRAMDTRGLVSPCGEQYSARLCR